MIFTEEQLKAFAQPISKSEEERCLRAIRMTRDALKDLGFTDTNDEIKLMYEDTLAYSTRMQNTYTKRDISIFLQGSYANNTNIRQNSDVDIAVVQEDVFHADYREGISRTSYGFTESDYKLSQFKDDVEGYLRNKFGNDVERKNKSIKIHGNSGRVDTDSVPSRRYRDYRKDFLFHENNYIGGIGIQADDGEYIINYPEQHIKNGKEKNVNTGRRYKKMVRIAKHIRKIMEEKYYSSASSVSSFGLESLIWNVPDELFEKYTSYKYIFEEIVEYLYKNKELFCIYQEANGIKLLCSNEKSFIAYKDFITSLYSFYEYK